MPKKIETLISEKLKGEAQKNALDFITHVRAHDEIFTICACGDEDSMWNGCAVSNLGYMVVNGSDDFPGPWTMWFEVSNIGEYAETPIDECIKEFAWKHVSPCGNCGKGCTPATNTKVFGKDFENTCQSNLLLVNPDAEAVGYMKKLADIRKNDIIKRR